MTATYRGRYSGIGKMFQRSWMQRGVRRHALQLKAVAEGNSPVGDPANDSHAGRYLSSFDVVPLWKNVPFRGNPRMRAGARLINTSPEARIVEYGNSKTPRYAVLSKSIDDLKAVHGA